MRHRRFHVLRASSLVALGLIALSSAVAQAANLSDGGAGGLYRILGSSALVPNVTVTGSSEGHVRLLAPGQGVSLLCTSVDVTEGKFLTDTELLMKLLFLNCGVRLFENEEEELSSCVITNGREFTLALIGLSKKHETKPYVLFDADGGEALGSFKYESGKGCPLPLTTTVTGSVVAEATTGEVVTQLLKFSRAIQELFQVGTAGDHLKYNTHEAYVDGSLTISLTGAHTGCAWGIV